MRLLLGLHYSLPDPCQIDEKLLWLLSVDRPSLANRVIVHEKSMCSMCPNLAGLYRRQDRLSEAEKLVRKVIEATTRTLGQEHPHVLIEKASLALT